MIIDDLRSEEKGNLARVVARISWEDCSKLPRELYYETDSKFAHDLTCNPHAFLTACLMPAMYSGERRIKIDGAIDPELLDGLDTAIKWVSKWHPDCKPLKIEAKIASPIFSNSWRAGQFLSGGIDSLATLRHNRLTYPQDHPRSIKVAFFVHGFDIGHDERDKELGYFQLALSHLKKVAHGANVTLIPVFTNVRHLNNDMDFWMNIFFGPALASVAHVFSNSLSIVHIASTWGPTRLSPCGSHPVLDPLYSSSTLRIVHDGIKYSRFEKIKLVSEWDVGLKNIRVCTNNSPNEINCGSCEKCITVMLVLLALDKIEQCDTFKGKDLTPQLIQQALPTRILTRNLALLLYPDEINILKKNGYHELARFMEKQNARYQGYIGRARRHLRIIMKTKFSAKQKTRMEKFDQRYLRGVLSRFV